MTDGPALGRYILERRIASGGMADVYLARQTGAYGFAKSVAIKVLKREIARDDESVKMFIREALVAAEFRHTNLAQVYEVGEADGRLFIAMELVPGVSVATMLRELAAREKPMPLNVAVRIAIDTLDGLAYAHEAAGPDGKPLGLVHRDVSPQNIMVAVDGAVKIVDFGIARAELAFGKTMAPRIKGKYSYMPPEQWEVRGTIDARTDIFAVGIVLYEMTTGVPRLFRGETPKDVYKAVVLDPVPDPRERVADYPPWLATVVMRALERGPNARWPSARAMRTALVDHAKSEGWSLTSRAVADALRTAIGPGDIEAHWEPVVAEARPVRVGPDGEPVAAAEGLTARERPPFLARGLADRPRALAGTRVALLGALVVAGLGGYALGRSARRPVPALRESPRALASEGVTAPRVLRVRGSDVLLRDAAAGTLGARWSAVHPDVALLLAAAPASEAIGEVSAGAADVAVVLRRVTDAEAQRARARGIDLGEAAVGRAVAAVVVHGSVTLPALSLTQARALFRGETATFEALGVTGGPVRLLLRPAASDVLAQANETLLGGAPARGDVESVELDATARALVAQDPHAVTVLPLGAVNAADGAVRVVPVTADALEYPVWVVTRGPAAGDARAFVDWLRAPDLAATLRALSVVAP